MKTSNIINATFIISLFGVFAFADVAKSPDACDPDMIATYLAKKSCFYNNDEAQCRQLSMITQIVDGAAATGMGGYISKIESKTMTPSVKERYINVVNEIRAERNLLRKFDKMLDDSYDEITKQKTGGTFKTLVAYRRSEIVDEKLVTAIEVEGKMRYRKLMQAEPDSSIRDKMEKFINHPSEALANRLQNAVAKNFPEEWKRLEPYFLEKAQLRIDELADESGGASKSARAKFEARIKELQSKQHIILENSTPQTRFLLLLMQDGNNYGTYRGTLVAEARDLDKQDAKARHEAIKTNTARTGAARATGAGILGAGSLALISADYVIDKNTLTKCKDTLNLGEDEIKFYDGKSHLFSPSKVKSKRSTQSCDRFQIEDPVGTLAALKNDLGYIPSGTCNIIKNESDRLDKMIPKDSSIESAECGNLSGSNFVVTGTGTDSVFEAKIGNKLYRAKYDVTRNWPDFADLKILSQNGTTDIGMTDDFKTRFPKSMSFNEDPNPNFDLKDISTFDETCIPNNSANHCQLFQAAILARVQSSVTQKTCVAKFAEGLRNGTEKKRSSR